MEGRVSKITKEMTIKKKEYKKLNENNSKWLGSEDEIQMKSEISESEKTLRSLRVSYFILHLLKYFHIHLFYLIEIRNIVQN